MVKANRNGRLEHSATGDWRSLAPDLDSLQGEKRRRYLKLGGHISMRHTYLYSPQKGLKSGQFSVDRALHRARGEGAGRFITQAADVIRVLTAARHAGEQLF
jgi:hypothetical protein